MRIVSARRVVSESGIWIACISVLFFLVLIGTKSTLFAAAAVCMAAMIVLVVCFDLTQAGTLLVTVAMFLAPLNNLRLGSSYVTASDVIFVVGFAVLTPTVLRNRIEIPPMFLLGLGILLTMGTIASVASPIPIVSANQVGRLLVGAFMLPIFFMVWRPPTTVVVRLAGAYILGTVFSVGYGLVQGPVAGDARYIGFTYHPNYLGLSCLLAASLVPYVVAMIQPGFRWIFWGSSLVCAYGVWISGSRAALLVLVMIAVVYPFIEGSVRAVGVVLLGVAGVLAFSGRLLQEDGNSALGRLFGSGSASGSDIERKTILSAAWKQFQQHPLLGNGFDGGIGSHNIYLQVAVAVGIFGLLGYLFIMWTAIRPLFWQGTNHRLAYPVLAYMAIGPLTNTLWDRLIWAVLALTFAVNVRPPSLQETEDEPDGVLAEIRNPR
jgi:O-antigen ligase